MSSTQLMCFVTIVLTVSTVGSSSDNNKNSTTSEGGKGVRKTIADRWNAGYHHHQHHPRRLQKSPSNGCAENQIRVRRECYNKTSLFSPCKVKEQCQSMVAHSYCGFPEREDGSLDRHQCICEDGYRPEKDDISDELYYCTIIHECSTEHYNADHRPGDCPLEHEFCARNICLCAPNYRRNSASFNCLWAVPDRPEPGTGYAHSQWWSLSPKAATIVIIILAVAILIVSTIVGIMFCCPQAKLTTITTTSALPDRNSFIPNHGQKTYRQDSAPKYNLLPDNS